LEDLESRDLAEARGTPEGQSVEQLIKDFKRGRAKPKAEKSLTQFIVEQGGIRDERGEVRNMLGNNLRSRPGLLSNKGLPLDRMAEAAREAGYFDDMQQAGLFVNEGRAWQAGENLDPLDARAFMNALEEDFSGRNRRFGRTEDVAGRERQDALADLDEYLRSQGTDIDAPLPDILRTLRRQNPDAPGLSLDELIEADRAYAWYQDAVATKKAKRGRRPAVAPEAPVEASAEALEQVQPGQPSAAQQGQFSARVPAGATQTQVEQPTEQAAPNQDKARQIVQQYLAELKAEGRQGRLIAKDLETLLNDRQFDANQIYQAFTIAKTLTKTMPGNADYRLKFLPDLVISKKQAEAAKASGAKAGDKAQAYIEYPTESLPGFINISLAPDMLPLMRETAAHEAFHVLQTYFGQYDKTFADRINKFFRNDMTIADLEPSIKRRLMGLKAPGTNQSYYDSLVEGLGDAKLSASEAQAYAFGSLIDAMNRGQRVTALIPSFQRFTVFARNFFNTMKRALTGDGFTSPADILTQAQQRGRAMEQAAPQGVGQQFSAKKVTDRDPVLEEAARGVREGSVSRAQYEQLVNERKPVTPYAEAPQPATRSEIIRALELTDPRKVSKVGVPSETLKRGDLVGLRLDIPAYSKQNTWVVSVHEAKGQSFYAGTAIGYEPVAMAKNVQLGVVPGAAMKIAAGDIDKSTIAVMRGEWEPTTPEDAKARADAALNDPAWIQVGMDPRRHQYFYDRTSKEPVVSADEVIQIGPLVLAKNPIYASKGNYQFSARRVPSVAGLAPFGQRVPASTPQSINQADLVVQYDVLPKYIGDKLTKLMNPKTAADFKKAERYRGNVERFFMKFQDKMLPMGRMIDEVRRSGGNVAVSMDTYMKEDLLQSKVAEALGERKVRLYDPMIKALGDLVKSGVSYKDFGLYLYARHATERNERMAEINEDTPDGGSGMTNKTAADTLAAFAANGQLAKMERVAPLVDAIVADTNKLRVDAGLTPDFTAMDVIGKTPKGKKPFKNYTSYVPLKGFAEESPDADDTEIQGEYKIGRALGAKGREDKRALGRESMADPEKIVPHVIMQNNQAVIRAETNKVGQSFLELLRANPNQTKGFAEIIAKVPLKSALVNGVVKTVPDPFYKYQPDVLVVKEGGSEVAVRIKDENLARALNGLSALSPHSQNLLIQAMGTVNRYLAKINTAWNPEFLITNFARDLQTFGVNVQQYNLTGIGKDSVRDLKGAISGVRDSVRGTNNNPVMRQAYERFKQLGGTTELYGFPDIEGRIEEINNAMEEAKGIKPGAWRQMANKTFIPVKNFIEDYNTIVENGIRTSFFKNLVDRGINEERAAYLAKNVTVNFSKGGENRVFMNSMYLFYNAALQGNMAMMNAIGRSKKVRKIVGGIVVAGVLQDVINSMLSDVGDDDEAIYDKIPDHVLKRSFVMMDPFGLSERGYFSFPLPYGFNAFYNMGREMSKTARGKSDPLSAAGNIVGTFVDAFNPIGGTENFLNFMSPTITDPVVEIWQNKDFSGRPIVPERGGFGISPPESQKYWNNTFAPYVDIASFLNEVTGGTPVIPGKVDISPSLMQYMVNYATGGVGKFVERSFTTATTTIPGALRGDLEELDVKGVPFLRSLYGNVTSREDMTVYTERMNEVLQVRQEIRQAAQSGMPERVQAALERYPGQVQIMDAFNSLSRDRMQISRQINEITRNANIPDDAKKDIIKSLRDQQNMLVQMANRLYIQNVERR
jgi:hypothetical protein